MPPSEIWQYLYEELKKTNLPLDKARMVDPAKAQFLYQCGFRFYQEEKYEEALRVFQDLLVAFPLKKEHWHAYGASLQMLNKPKEALRAWAIFAILDPDSPYPHFYASKCYELLGNDRDRYAALYHLKSRYSPLPEDITSELASYEST